MLCDSCPRHCKVDRSKNQGYCVSPENFAVSKAMLHKWEEPIVSGEMGAGNIFFAGCNMRCVFCQNHIISQGSDKLYKEVDEEGLAKIMLNLQMQGAENINLVSPMHYISKLPKAIELAKNEGLSLPIIYNTNSYENVQALRSLNGLVDVYLADFKYFDDEYAIKYSRTPHYFDIASKALSEMYNQVGLFHIDDNLIKKGIIVRILLLPNLLIDAKNIVRYLYDKFGDNIIFSLMNQYTPMYKAKEFPEINRLLTEEEYDEFVDFAIDLGIENGFIQEERDEFCYTPDFDLSGL